MISTPYLDAIASSFSISSFVGGKAVYGLHIVVAKTGEELPRTEDN